MTPERSQQHPSKNIAGLFFSSSDMEIGAEKETEGEAETEDVKGALDTEFDTEVEEGTAEFFFSTRSTDVFDLCIRWVALSHIWIKKFKPPQKQSQKTKTARKERQDKVNQFRRKNQPIKERRLRF